MLKDVLRQAREDSTLSQEEVAKLIGVTKQTYLKWENGTTEPKASQIRMLSSLLRLSADEICNGVKFIKYDLAEFITKLSLIKPEREVEILETWECIKDHGDYFKRLQNLSDGKPNQ